MMQLLRTHADLYNIVLVSICFMTLFSAFNSLQNYATSLLPGSLGKQSLTVLYISVAVTVFSAPSMVHKLGTRATLIVGAWLYVAYMASLIHIVPDVVLVMSVVIGFGAAILWVALGVFITQNSRRDTYGRNTGIFWAIFQISQLLGNLVAYFALSRIPSYSVLFIGFTIVGGVGAAGLLFLRKPSDAGSLAQIQAADALAYTTARTTVTASLKQFFRGVLDAFKLFTHAQMLLMLPIMFFSGMELAFWTGEFTLLLDPNVLGLVMTFAGVGEVVGGYVMGRLSDFIGRASCLGLGAVIYGVGLALAAEMKAGSDVGPTLQGAPLGAYFAALCFGLGDSCFNTNIYATVSQLYDKARADPAHPGVHDPLLTPSMESMESMPVDKNTHSAAAFTVFQLAQNLGSAVGYYYGLQIPLHGPDGTLTQIWVQTSFLAVGLGSFVLVMVYFVKHDVK